MRTAINIGLRVIPPTAGLISHRPTAKPALSSVGHGRPQEVKRRDTKTLDTLLNYTLNRYQEKINKLKKLDPDTIGYESLINDIDNLQGKLDQIRKQIGGRRQ